MIEVIIIPIVIWGALCTPKTLIPSIVDRITHAKFRKDRDTLQLMLDHFKSRPQTWSVSRNQASFPLEGAKQIHLIYSEDHGWQYALSSFGREFTDLTGFFKSEFIREINAEASRREQRSLMRSFYPEIEGTLLLS